MYQFLIIAYLFTLLLEAQVKANHSPTLTETSSGLLMEAPSLQGSNCTSSGISVSTGWESWGCFIISSVHLTIGIQTFISTPTDRAVRTYMHVWKNLGTRKPDVSAIEEDQFIPEYDKNHNKTTKTSSLSGTSTCDKTLKHRCQIIRI